MLTQLKSSRFVKWMAASALVVTAAGVLSGCYVEERRPYHARYRPVIVVR